MASNAETELYAGTYLKVIRFSEPTNPDGFVILYLRPNGRFLFIGYWLGYELSVVGGTWTMVPPTLHLRGYGQMTGDAFVDGKKQFLRIFELATVHATPTLTAEAELKGWSLLSWTGPFAYVGEHTIINPTRQLPESIADVDRWTTQFQQFQLHLPPRTFYRAGFVRATKHS